MEIGDPPAKYKSAVWKLFGFPKYKEGLQNETSERSTSYRRTLIHSTNSLVSGQCHLELIVVVAYSYFVVLYVKHSHDLSSSITFV